MAKRKPPCGTCGGTGALPAERCPACTKPRLGTLPRETRKMYLELYARSGRWEPGLFLFVNAVSPELRTESDRARKFYLEKIKPIEDRSEWSEWGLVPPKDVLPAPTFAPFVPALRPSQGGPGVVYERGSVRVDLSRTCPGCGQKTIGKLGVCSLCGMVKQVQIIEPPSPETNPPGG
jgi:hypothetical protein